MPNAKALFKHHSTMYCCWLCPPLYDHSVAICWWMFLVELCPMPQSLTHFKLVSWTWCWVHCPPVAFLVTRPRPAIDSRMHHASKIYSNCVMLSWANISEQCFQHFVEFMALRIKGIVRAKLCPTQQKQGIPNKVGARTMTTEFFLFIYFLK